MLSKRLVIYHFIKCGAITISSQKVVAINHRIPHCTIRVPILMWMVQKGYRCASVISIITFYNLVAIARKTCWGSALNICETISNTVHVWNFHPKRVQCISVVYIVHDLKVIFGQQYSYLHTYISVFLSRKNTEMDAFCDLSNYFALRCIYLSNWTYNKL